MKSNVRAFVIVNGELVTAEGVYATMADAKKAFANYLCAETNNDCKSADWADELGHDYKTCVNAGHAYYPDYMGIETCIIDKSTVKKFMKMVMK